MERDKILKCKKREIDKRVTGRRKGLEILSSL